MVTATVVQSKQAAGPAAERRQACPEHQHDGELRQQRYDEPGGLERRLVGVQHQEQDAESQEVEDRADQSEDDHEALNIPDFPMLRLGHDLRVDVVRRDRHRRQVGEEVVEQNLLCGERQKGKERRGQRHADHIAEIGAGRDADVFERVREGSSPVLDPAAQDIEIRLHEDDVGTVTGNVRCLVDRNADVGRVQCRCIVDAVAEIADRAAGTLESADDALLLLRIDLDEEIGARARGATAPRPRASASSSPVSIAFESSPTASDRCAVTYRLSPLTILTRMPRCERSARVRLASSLGGSKKSRNPANVIPASSP